MIEKAKQLINDYQGQPHVRGTRDCNLMILELFDKDTHDAIKGRYKTIKGGVRAALKHTGFRSMREYLEDKFTLVRPGFQRPLDVIAFKDKHDIYLCLGKTWFGVKTDETFGIRDPLEHDQDAYLIYRKGV